MAEIANFKGEATAVDSKTLADREADALLKLVGDRVRAARERKGLPRRVLSNISGVSPRYLAQLESGEGNISIGLLQRVAQALGLKIEWLVGQDDPWTSDVMQLAELYRNADPEARKAAVSLLRKNGPAGQRAERICLIGLRGAGKSTLGRKVGQSLDLPFVELNKQIEARGGMPMDEIMALYGQEGYRRLESDALDWVVETHDRMILAVAGGIVSEPDTFAKLLRNFHTIWIKARPEEHMERVLGQGDTRPMAGNPEAMAQLRTIFDSREVLYRRAEATLDTTSKSVDQSAQELEDLINSHRFLG